MTGHFIPEDVYREWIEAGNDWADKLAAAELLENTIRTLRAKLTLDAKRAEQCSMAQAEEIAYSCTDYRQALVEASNARKEANRARVRYDATRALFEARRTVEASHRAATRAAT